MSGGSLEEELEEARQGFDSEDYGPIEEILENGEMVDEDTYNSIFHHEEILPDTVTKVFYGENPENIREQIGNFKQEFVPEAIVEVIDTSKIQNPEIITKSKNGVVVLERRSQRSILERKSYDSTLRDSVDFVDSMVEEGQIIDDFKAEEIHEYADGLKYVDFEDKNAVTEWPMLSGVSSVREISQRMANMYGKLAVGLKERYGVNLGDVKNDIAYSSNTIDTEEYENKGFVPEMIGNWKFES